MLFVLLALICFFYFLPGLLLHVRLRERGLTLPVCLGLGLAGLIVLDVWIASLFRYLFPLQLAVNLFTMVGLGWWARREIPAWLGWTRTQWPWPILGWAAVAAIFIVPAFVINLPFDTDAQGFSLLALTVRLSGDITTLSPFWPEIKYLYSPAFYLLAAQLSDLAGGAAMPAVVMALGHASAVATVAGVFAVGCEFGGARLGAWAAVFSIGGYALFSTLMDSAYTNVLGNFLTTAILVLVFRAARAPNRFNIVVAAVALASLPLSHPDSIIHLLMAYVPFYLTIWLARERPARNQYLTLVAVVPFLAVALCLPWLVRVLPLAGGIDVHERQNPALAFIEVLFRLNGWLPPILAIGGLGLALRRRGWFDLWLIGWMAAIVEVSSLGNLDSISRQMASDPMQIFYPYGVAWHATLIPVPILAAMAVCAVPRLGQWTPPPIARTIVSVVIILASVLAGVFSRPIVQLSKGRAFIVGALSSSADEQAMLWLRNNAPPDAFILNYPGIEGDWAPVIAERKTVQFREQLFYVGAGPAWELQERLRPAYLDPASRESEKLIREAGVNYVLVPQVIGRPESFADMLRWRPPFVEPLRSSFADATYLDLARDFDGAQIWRVKK